MQKEPALIIGVITSIVMMLMAFGYINWSDEQMTAFNQMLLVVVPAVLPLIAAVITRYQVYSPNTVATEFVPKEGDAK